MNHARLRIAAAARAIAVAFVIGFVVAGCGTGSGLRLFVNSEADMTFYTKVAVVPFANLSAERFAGERVGRAFYTELVIAEQFQLVEDGDTVVLKGGRTPQQASMPLLAVPYRPSWIEHLILSNRNILADQMAFLKTHLPKNPRGTSILS